MKNIKIILLIGIFLLTVFSCKQGDISSGKRAYSEQNTTITKKRLYERKALRSRFKASGRFKKEKAKRFGGASNISTAPGETGKDALKRSIRKISKTATIKIRVKKFDEAYNKIIKITESVTYAYIASSYTYVRENKGKYGTIKIRVPTPHFRDIYVNIKSIGKVKSDRINTKDFTKQYFDLEAQLITEKGYKNRLETIMKTRARNYDEVQDAYQRIRTVQKRIDRIKGYLRYINSITDYSTINISFYEGKEPSSSQSFGRVFGRIWKGIKTGFYNMILVFSYIIEYSLTLSILIGLFIVGFFILKKYLKKKKQE